MTSFFDPEIESILCRSPRMFLNNTWVEPDSIGTIRVYDPSTEELLTHSAFCMAKDVDHAVAVANKAFKTWSKTTPLQRSQCLWNLADQIEKRKHFFAKLEVLDTGKPYKNVVQNDIPFSINLFRYMAGLTSEIKGETFQPYAKNDYHFYTEREPIGVVAQIIPWNFPLMMAAWKLAPALAAGCTVVLKPAEQTPLSSYLLADCIVEAGFQPGVVNIVYGEGIPTGTSLVSNPRVHKIAFTGSTDVGKFILHAVGASNLKKVSLELGGKSPGIVLADADIDRAAKDICTGAFYNAGQCCSASSRIYVEQSVFSQFVEKLESYANELKLVSDLGPVISVEQYKKVQSAIRLAEKQGAKNHCKNAYQGKGFFIRPTILTDIQHTMDIQKEEVFGPVVTVCAFEDLDEAIHITNATKYGLAAGIWTQSLSKAITLSKKLQAGTVWVNCYNIADPALPFGGYKQSGWGREMGKVAIESYTEVKSVCIGL